MYLSHSIFLVFVVTLPAILGQTIDCQRPPQLVDPAFCCRDGGRDQNAEKCAQRVGVKPNVNGGPPSLNAATCLADCILKESRYVQESQRLHLITIQNDLSARFSNDTSYVNAMVSAFTKCEPQAQKRLALIQQFNVESTSSQLSKQQGEEYCSPFAAMVLGCTYMEYFKNCPAHRWTENAGCSLAKRFVTQCALGA